MFFVIVAFALLIVRLFYLQVIEGEELRRLSKNNCIRLQSLDAPRGLIFDRKGRMLVDNRPSFDLSINLSGDKPIGPTLERISQYINMPEKELTAKITRSKKTSPYKPVFLKKDIGRDALAAIEVHRFDLPGVIVNIRPVRHYINKKSASHLIGYLSEINSEELKCGEFPGCKGGDFIGKFGVEKAYEHFLRGQRGGQQVEVNAVGQVVRVLETVKAHPGHNIFLTIDQVLQEKAESLLRTKTGADRKSVV